MSLHTPESGWEPKPEVQAEAAYAQSREYIESGHGLADLESIYGGAPVPEEVIEQAVQASGESTTSDT